MDRYFLHKIVCLFLVFGTYPAVADCPLADLMFQKKNESAGLMALKGCAIHYNDDVAQMKLAEVYAKGKYGETPDNDQVLYFYQLAAETGNAEAQVLLAEKLMQMDQDDQKRAELMAYQKDINVLDADNKNAYNGAFIHPYALLSLAAESPQKKWYYPSQNRSAPARTMSLLKSYKITDAKKKEALRQASQFKTRKLLQMAQEVLPPEEYTQMENKLKSPQQQKAALLELEQKMNSYLERQRNLKSKK